MTAVNDVYEIDLFDLEDDPSGQEALQEEAAVYTPDDALIVCVNRKGRVDLGYMSGLTAIPVGQLAKILQERNAILQDPALFLEEDKWDVKRGWLLWPQYCAGNIPRKLKEAEEAEARFPGRFRANIRALQSILPPKVELKDIHFTLGSPWIPARMYAQFAKELFRFRCWPNIYFSEGQACWKVVAPLEAGSSIRNNFIFGTREMSGLKIIERTLNGRTVKVYRKEPSVRKLGSTERVLDKAATLAAQEKQKVLMAEFLSWVGEDKERQEKLQKCYNDIFVGYVAPRYSGDFLRLPDMNPEVKLYPHQREAIARILLSDNNVLLAQEVGGGKTYEMAVGVHELKRVGRSRKNLVVVPNNVLDAAERAHRLLYPNDSILVVSPRKFVPAKREAVLEDIRTGDYVAVYIASSCMDLIGLSKKYWLGVMDEEIARLEQASRETVHREDRWAIDAKVDKLKKKRFDYVYDAPECPYIPFDKLEIDTLVVDEAHLYKGIPLQTRADGIVGLHTKGSKKAAEMLEKCRCAKRVIFSTGTPLTNSLSDLYALQFFLQFEELRFRGVNHFDTWLNCFGEREIGCFEVDVDGAGLRPMTRFSRFKNLPELMGLFSSVCQFHFSAEKPEGLPLFRGYCDVMVPKSPVQELYFLEISRRTDLVRLHKVLRTEDNLLLITVQGRAAAADIRLVLPEERGRPQPGCKVEVCADKTAELYRAYPGTCQMIFCDIGTPKSSFNLYDAMKDALMARGIPEEEIAFVHDATSDAARAKLFADINAGRIRVIMGSTIKLGVGVNIQERMVAAHHLDLPWRPSDLIQREGRILRRGNTCEEVFIFRYITSGSLDSVSWQILENKTKFIASFLAGADVGRDAEDIADVVLSCAEIKALALGNPLVKERVETANLLERARIASRQRQKQVADLRMVVENAPRQMGRLREMARKARADYELYTGRKASVPNEERQAFGEELLEALADNEMQRTERVFGDYQGFDIILPAGMQPEDPYVYVRSETGGNYHLQMDGAKPMGCSRRVDHLLEDLSHRAAELDQRAEDAGQRMEEALADMEKGNPYPEECEKLSRRLEELDRRLAEVSEEVA